MVLGCAVRLLVAVGWGDDTSPIAGGAAGSPVSTSCVASVSPPVTSSTPPTSAPIMVLPRGNRDKVQLLKVCGHHTQTASVTTMLAMISTPTTIGRSARHCARLRKGARLSMRSECICDLLDAQEKLRCPGACAYAGLGLGCLLGHASARGRSANRSRSVVSFMCLLHLD